MLHFNSVAMMNHLLLFSNCYTFHNVLFASPDLFTRPAGFNVKHHRILIKKCFCRAVKPDEGKAIPALRRGKNLSAVLSTSNAGPVHTSPTRCTSAILSFSFTYSDE